MVFVFGRAQNETTEYRCTEDAKMPNLTKRYSQLSFDFNNSLHSSFGIHELASKIVFSKQHQSGFIKSANEKRTLIFGQSSCRGKKLKSLLERSTCPWRIMMTIDEDRFPRQMFTAECVCKACKGRNPSKFQCEPILFPTKILRQKYMTKTEIKTGTTTAAVTTIVKACEKVNGEEIFKYEEVFEPIVTGCTCSKKSNTRNKTAKPRNHHRSTK